MKFRNYLILFFFGIIWSNSTPISACTTAIVSGKFTPDARPLLWKHRDSGTFQNELKYFKDGKYDYIGLINADDSLGNEVWSGSNSTGFAIMNAASYNLNTNDTTQVKDREGLVMKKALQECATLLDFEMLLDSLPKPLGVEANFGVIDARGGAAYYETGNFTYRKFDVNDPRIAPFGYIIRTNYSFTGQPDQGYGYIRYLTVEKLFYQAAAENRLTFRFILQDVSRSLKHSLTNVDLFKPPFPANFTTSQFVCLRDFIPRFTSVSAMLIQGVCAGESPDLTTIWTILGFPLSSVVVPTWVAAGSGLPKVVLEDESGNAPLCKMALDLKRRCFPVSRGSGPNYLNLAALVNRKNTGIRQQLQPLEEQILRQLKPMLAKWRREGLNPVEVLKFYQWIDRTILRAYKALSAKHPR